MPCLTSVSQYTSRWWHADILQLYTRLHPWAVGPQSDIALITHICACDICFDIHFFAWVDAILLYVWNVCYWELCRRRNGLGRVQYQLKNMCENFRIPLTLHSGIVYKQTLFPVLMLILLQKNSKFVFFSVTPMLWKCTERIVMQQGSGTVVQESHRVSAAAG